MKKLIAIDGNSLLFRAYHATALRNLMQTSDGVYTNALYSFINMVNRIQNVYEYDYIIVAFDASKDTFRKKQFDGYKGTRSRSPQELNMQFPLVREYLDIMNIPNYEIEEYEADDIIGTLATLGDKENIHVDVITSDKDMLQLLSNNVDLLMPQKGTPDLKVVNCDNLHEIWDVTPKQIIDLKGLMGDASDNIPGVAGVGEKTAVKLLKEYNSIENLYEHVDQVKGKMKEKLIIGKESAFMSKQLATIVTDMKLPFEISDLVIKEPNCNELKNFLYKYEMKSLVKRLNIEDDKPIDKDEFTIDIVENISLDLLVDNNFISLLSLEENYHFADFLGLFVADNKKVEFIYKDNIYQDTKLLNYLENNIKISHDAKRNIILAKWHNINIANINDDIMISSYLLDVDNKTDANIIIDANFNIETLDEKALKKADEATIINQKAIQAYYLNKMNQINHTKMNEIELNEVYQVEIKISDILANMEYSGIKIDQDQMNSLTIEYEQKTQELEQLIKGYYPEEDFNVNSPIQLATIIFEKLNIPYPGANGKKVKKYSTSVDILNEVISQHPIIPLVLEYRTYKKLLSTYLSPMPKYIKNDDRVHTIYKQALAQTGRLSSIDPNLQNIATKTDVQKQVKKMFVSKEGYSLLSFDYSQIELRVLASFSDDPVFIAAFNNNEDIHASTAAKVNGIPIKDVTSEERSKAKATNFGIIYGLSDYGLARQITVSREEAATFIKKYYEIYPNIHGYLNKLIEDARDKGYTRTILNRIRYIKNINSNNFNIRQNAQRQAMNTPIQGSAADILKLAMINIETKLKETDLDITMLLQVHDELIFEVKDDQINEATNIIKKEMENAYKLKVELAVDAIAGKNWYEL
ncbi:DNA polymerase I [Mycoplasma sp. P36-A1]|uniref:DNA polymerase I n=1 Tax=Mycoplasma sp. P36-A1 TaxID=3252900 RepID=UPI003C2B6651